MKKNKKSKLIETPSLHVPWTLAYDGDLDKAIESTISALIARHEEKEDVILPPKLERALQQEFKKSQEGLSPFYRVINWLAKEIEAEAEIGPMKEWHRTVTKFAAQGRKPNDLGRGRIFVDDPEQVREFYKIWSSKDKDGHIPGMPKNTFIVPGSYDDYLAEQRWSGYASALHFDICVNSHKGHGGGTLENQIMPRSYLKTYGQSHKLFDIIRMIHEIPAPMRSKEQQYILDGLIIANGALFDEFALRPPHFSVLRKKPIKELDQKSAAHARDVIDRLWTPFENFHGRRPPWMDETMEAFTFAKSSVFNMSNWGAKPGPDYRR